MDWEIKSRSTACEITGKIFEEEQSFYTVLIDTPEGLARQDMCVDAWKNFKRQEVTIVSYWKSAFKGEPEAEPEAFQKEDAEGELRRLLKSLNPNDAKVCYILALLLERKKLLKPRERTELNGADMIIYEHVKTQETFVVPDPKLKLQEIAELQMALDLSSTRVFSKDGATEKGPERVS